MIGIIGAMDIEIEALVNMLDNKKEEQVAFLDVYVGTILSKEVVIVKSNEGKVNAAVAAQIIIDKFNVEKIINIGVAGAIDKNLDIYSIVVSSATVEFDLDTTSLGYELGYTFGINKVIVETSNNMNNDICNIMNGNIKSGIIASSDMFVTDENIKKMLYEKFNAIAVDMESASINHVCALNKVEFCAIRVISDSGNKIEYRTFANEAAKRLDDVILKYLSI